MRAFKLPDLGEGLHEAEIVSWHVQEGDTVVADQPLLSVETAKAITEIPSPWSGRISKLRAAPGDVVWVDSVLVEYFDDSPGSARRDEATVVGAVAVGREVVKEQTGGLAPSAAGIKAAPAVRALASRLGVDLTIVTPTGPDGLITATDVERVSKILSSVEPLEPLRGVRRVMAANMAIAHAEVVAVTIMDDADIDAWAPGEDISIRLIRALVAGVRAEPGLNCWYDAKAMGRHVLKQIHLGLAVDTEDGLFVPIIRDIASKTRQQLRTDMDRVKKGVRERTLPAEELRGHTIALSNFGMIAGRYASPIVMPPTVAILGSGRIGRRPVAVGDEVKVHTVCPLSLTIDHRAVNGGEAARFLKAVVVDLQKAD